MLPRKNGTITLYNKIFEPLPVINPFVCGKKYEKLDYYTILWGDHIYVHPPIIKQMAVSKSECLDMINYKTCPHGSLPRQGDKMFKTNNPLNVDFPGLVKGFFIGTQTTEVTNCMLEETSLLYMPNTLELMSGTYDVSHCNYSSGSCFIKNGSLTLIWTPECYSSGCRKCRYQRLHTVDGTFSQKSFLSLDRQIALTFSDDPPSIFACDGTQLKISDQGIAISDSDYEEMQKLPVTRRAKKEFATTEELAAEMTAADFTILQRVEHLFDLQCQTKINDFNPTVLIRKILGRDDVMGKWRSPHLIEAFPCAEVAPENIELRSTYDKCYSFIPVRVKIPNLGWVDSFIDPYLRIVSPTSVEADCRTNAIHYLERRQGVFKVNTLSNETILL
ncbi:MAG TPA: hypothetical protein VFV08_06185, partial [Puia sp.]|nr:hypothetical protein [Puia sp.]